jgi:hypothetical protein
VIAGKGVGAHGVNAASGVVIVESGVDEHGVNAVNVAGVRAVIAAATVAIAGTADGTEIPVSGCISIRVFSSSHEPTGAALAVAASTGTGAVWKIGVMATPITTAACATTAAAELSPLACKSDGTGAPLAVSLRGHRGKRGDFAVFRVNLSGEEGNPTASGGLVWLM